MLVPSTPVVHLELHTGDLQRAQAFYSQLCDWHPDRVDTRHGSYHTLELGGGLGGGIVSATTRPLWLPYVEVSRSGPPLSARATSGDRPAGPARAGRLAQRRRHAGGGEIAFWQAKR
jgi:catechol 2,3-dioxygenase-like lactoylglutathione lyase family enzyme